MSVASFALCALWDKACRACGQSPELVRRITYASELSYGVYLVHALVIVILESGRLGFSVDPCDTRQFSRHLSRNPRFSLQPMLTDLLRRVRILKCSCRDLAVTRGNLLEKTVLGTVNILISH